MDNRSLAFFLIVFIAVFSTNYYFSNQDLESKRQWLKELERKKYEEKAELIEYVESKKTEPDLLPIYDTFESNAASNPFSKALLFENCLLTWVDSQAPDTLYISKDSQLQPYHKKTSNSDGTIAIYSQNPDQACSFDIKKLPKTGNFDIQLISQSNKTGLLTIDFAEYEDGLFSIPIEAPENDAIGLVEQEGQFYPAIFYRASNRKFSDFSEFSSNEVEVRVNPLTFTNGNSSAGHETFYILENDYQQLVFSSNGGSIVEINLPITDEASEGPIAPIEVDQKLADEHSIHSYFPGRPALLYDGTMQQIEQLAYYPLLRRNLSFAGTEKWKAFDVSSDFSSNKDLSYELISHTSTEIIFEARQPHRTIRKTYSLSDNDPSTPYIFNLDIEVSGNSKGLWLSTGITEVELISGSPSPQLKLMLSKNGGEVQSLSLPKADDTLNSTSVQPEWYANTNGFFGIITTPLNQKQPGYKAQYIPGSSQPSRLIEVPTIAHRYSINDLPSYQLQIPLKSTSRKQSFRIFAGPFKSDVLSTLDQTFTDPANGTSPKYIEAQSYHGWFSFISKPISVILMHVLKVCYWITNSWAISIILLTLILRLALYPLNSWSFKSMKGMQAIAPQVQLIQEKHKKHPQKAQMEIVELYRKNGVNPMSGCLPLLLQMPFLIGMFDLLKSSFELRGASFIPGWIDNLTAPDVLFSWSTPLPLIGTEFHALPVILAGAMLLQQRMSQTAPTDMSKATDQQRQQQAIGTMMSVVFLFMFYNLPSGLNLYWLFSMLFGILQQKFTRVQLETKQSEKK